MATTRKKSTIKVARNADDLAKLLGLSPVEAQLMKTKSEFSSIAVSAIEQSGMSVNQIVKRSGVARSKVSAVKNGATMSISIDLLVKIIAATDTVIKVRAA